MRIARLGKRSVSGNVASWQCAAAGWWCVAIHRRCMSAMLLLAWTLWPGLVYGQARGGGSIPDFAFIHISDIHIEPQPASAGNPGPNSRSVEAISWVCSEIQKPQNLPPANLTTPAPSFVIATGDLMEFGAIGKTWSNFENYFKPLEIPLYVAPGNHDNTWNAMLHIMRAKYGGDHYSFDKFGCHFVCLDSATPQEPLPSLEQRTITFLREDLKKVDPRTPVFLYAHHPLSSTEFAKPYEQLRFLKALEGYNVVLLLMGHGHGVRYERWAGLDSVMGGSTFGPNTGYSVVSVIDGTLRVIYRYRDEKKPMQTLLEKPIAGRPARGLEIVKPVLQETVSGDLMPVAVKVDGRGRISLVAKVNDSDQRQVELTPQGDGLFGGSVPLSGLMPGRHFVRVMGTQGRRDLDGATEFVYAPVDAPRLAGTVLKAGIKAEPVRVGKDLLVATTDGEVARVSFSSAKATAKTVFAAKAEILHAPALVDDTLYFGCGEPAVYAVKLSGRQVWRCPLKAPAYGTPAVDANMVYVVDNEGFVHGIDRASGSPRWSKQVADYAIEMSPLLSEGVLYFGAWDGHVYAVSTRDGNVKWKEWGPAPQQVDRKFRSRYYGPGDCSPVRIGDRIFVSDRAYRLGSYSLDGKYLGDIAGGIAAIGPTADGKGLLARGLDKGLTRYDAEGKVVWTQPVEMGRFPAVPVEAGGKVFACSNRGTVHVYDAATGKPLWQYQASPQLHVMAPVAADDAGSVYIAGMDGSVIQVTP